MAQLKKLTTKDVTTLDVEPITQETLQIVSQILNDVKKNGEEAVLEHSVRLGDIAAGEKHIYKKDEELKAAYDSLPADQQQLLQRTASRIRSFAESQKASLSQLTLAISGGRAGHSVKSLNSAGCYAPGGRYPLPSSVLMTVITARVAGVKTVWVASPKPAQITLAAAYVAGADALLRVGGAQSIAAFAYGAGSIPKCDAVVGPGNKFVTAAKQLIAGRVTIDMLAGPSECLVVVDKTSQPVLVAADLIAQAEHDPDSRPIVVNVIYDSENDIIKEIEAELEKQLATLPTADIARQAITANGFAVVVKGLEQAVEICDKLAPEHLELHIQNASQVKDKFNFYGSLFVGSQSAEVFGDYGAGPNHVLPTGGTARSNSGLSVFTFLKVRTWLEISDVRAAGQVLDDASALAKLEGLHGHANAAEVRRCLSSSSSSSSAPLSPISPAGLFQNAQQQEVIVTPETPLHISVDPQDVVVKLALPKGRMEQGIFKLLNDAGLGLKVESRGYRPTMGVKGFDVKLLKPQNIVEMVNIGSRDIGFTGADLVEELGANNITLVLDTSQDKVKLVAAAPENILTPAGEIVSTFSVGGRKLVVASEYKNITQRWMAKRGLTTENSTFVHSRGATEVFPPEDADIIVDNTSTGSTLKANRLRAFDELLHSSTCMYVNSQLWNDQSPVGIAKRRQIEMLVTLLRSVLDAQSKVILEFNVEKTKLEAICKYIPAMREPTISQLHGEQGFAVKSVVPRIKLFELIPLIKQHGGSDVIVTDLHHIVQ